MIGWISGAVWGLLAALLIIPAVTDGGKPPIESLFFVGAAVFFFGVSIIESAIKKVGQQ